MVPGASYSTPLLALEAIVLDTETTGLDARSARIVSIGALRLSGGSLRTEDRFEALVKPGGPIPKTAIAIHGITDDMVAAAPAFAEVAPDLEAFAGRAIVVGHAIHYDLAVLEREYALAGRLAAVSRTRRAHAGAAGGADSSGSQPRTPVRMARHRNQGPSHRAWRCRGGGDVSSLRSFHCCAPGTSARSPKPTRRAGHWPSARHAAPADYAPPSTGPAEDTHALARIDSFPYRHLVRDVMSAPALFAPPETTVREAVRLLIEKRVSSVFVRAASGVTGIVTERDILRALDEGGEARCRHRIDAIMKAPLQTVAEDAFLYRAIGRIERLGFRHLGVDDAAGEIVGAVTTRNLLRHRATTAIMLGDEIDSAADGRRVSPPPGPSCR